MFSLARGLQRAAARNPATPALIEEGGTLSYGALWEKSQRLAAELARRGVVPGSLVASSAGSSRLLAMLAWSLSHLGCAFMPLDPALPSERRDALLEAAGADWTVSDLSLPGETLACGPLQEIWDAETACAHYPVPEPSGEDGIALVVATSGSEGRPKGVMLSDANLGAAVRASAGRLPLAAEDVWLACLPLYHVGGLSILYRCAEAGAAVLLQQGFDACAAYRAMADHGATHASLVPAMLARLADAGPPPASLKCALTGGGPLSAALFLRARDAGWPICPSYGLSEAASQVATLHPPPADWVEGTVGKPLPGIEVEIEPGNCRIRVRGPTVMAGYANPQRELGLGLERGWFATGDSGYFDAAGKLVVLGRVDDILVSGGRNIHPREVESLLAAHPEVRDVAVLGLRDEVWGDRLAALVAGGGDMAALAGWCREHLPSHLRPRLLVAVPALPRNAMGKLERGRLRELLPDQDAGKGERPECSSVSA